MPKDDLVYIKHMLDLASLAVRKVRGLDRSGFDADENLRLALTHLIQTVGESARRVSAAFQADHPEIPWARVIGMRHRIVHNYLDVDLDLVWEVATTHLATLLADLERIAAPEEG